MNIPEKLQEAIEREAQKFNLHEILEAREELTERYRQSRPKKQGFMTTEAQRCSYIASRLPATYAVIHAVLEELRSRIPEIQIHSLLDLGAGPGSVMWAAGELFPELQQISLVEKDPDLAGLGKRLAADSELSAICSAQWQLHDLEQFRCPHPFDLITLSYSIGELSPSTVAPLIETSWQMAKQCLIVIEPGTPAGFARIRTIREQLISLGAHMVAPCPHALACPMTGDDWCHFSQRVERSFLHRRIKEGSLGYEDEKYSYLIFSKTAYPLPSCRVLRHPSKRSGHVNLTLCTSEGLSQKTISKRTPDLYRQARKAEWGDVLKDES